MIKSPFKLDANTPRHAVTHSLLTTSLLAVLVFPEDIDQGF